MKENRGLTFVSGFDAAECSAGVAALLAMIAPLPYSADFRPYFVIHDPVFNSLQGVELPSNFNSFPRLLGITNPYFLKAGALPDMLTQKRTRMCA